MPDTPARGSGSLSLESDFREVREERGLSFDDLHQETRVPVHVIRRFESGDLLSDPSFSDVYLKAFVKGYAKALGIPQARAVDAFEAHRAGRYEGQLREDYTPSQPPVVAAPEPSEPAAPSAPETPPARRPEPKAPPKPSAPAVEALRTGGSAVPASQSKPKVEPQRVTRPIVPTAKRSFDKNWGMLGGIAFVLIALVAVAMWLIVFRDDAPDEEAVATTDGVEQEAATDSTQQASEAPAGPRLQTPLQVTVTAGGGGLQWFRVTSDNGERSPNWIDAGTDQVFTADSSLVIWGEGNSSGPAFAFEESTLEIQGLRWTPANGTPVRITLQNGQALLDSLARAGAAAPPATPTTQPE